jgi:hypothetical protein
MKVFPSNLNVKNKDRFLALAKVRNTCYLRRDIYEFMLNRESEDEYFSLDEFGKRLKPDVCKEAVNEVIKELENLGWKCTMSFGGSGLFIYSTETPPKTCWEGDIVS